MNERIKELAEQAGIPAIDEVWDYNDRNLLVKDNGEWRAAVPSEIISTMLQSEKGLTKFAELIVQDCVNVLQDNGMWNSRVSDVLDEHFGVEE